MNEPGGGRAGTSRPGSLWLLGGALVVALGLTVALLSGRAGGRPTPQLVAATPTLSPHDRIVQGQALFDERCSTCHGPTAEGTDQGPPIVGLGPANYSFQMTTGRMPLAQAGTQPRPRPPVLSQSQIDLIIDYLVSLAPGGVPIPEVDLAAGDLSVGQATYQLNCAPCHGATGNGGSAGTDIAPNLHEATPTQVAEAIRIGPGTMPVFDSTTISQDELNSVVKYVQYLKAPDDAGGSSLDNVGPLVEGFVALLFGLGLIVVVTRFIGTRS